MCVREPKIRRMFIILPYGAEAMNDSPVDSSRTEA